MDNQKIKSVLESLLFVCGEPIKTSKLAKICGIPKIEIEKAADELAKDLAKSRGLCLIKKGDRLQMATAAENSLFVNQLVSGELSAELSKSALETISIIAYRGPITRAQIEAIRGVNCSYVLRGLLVRGLAERKESSGSRGYLYEISFDFLKHLGLASPKDLPDWKSLSENERINSVLDAQTNQESEYNQV